MNAICDDSSCDISNCKLRHPRICKFYREFRKCKFSEWCSYVHIENENDLDDLKKENEKMLTNIEKEIYEKDKVIEDLVKRVSELERKITEKDENMKNLEEKLNLVDEKLRNFENETEFPDKPPALVVVKLN